MSHTPEHIETKNNLLAIGKELGFYFDEGAGLGKMCHMAKPDCVWYYKGKAEKELYKVAKGDKCRHIPVVAFEVADSEQEKQLRGSLMSLQLANASVGIIVLVNKSSKQLEKRKRYLKKLMGRYSYMRARIWTKEYVDNLYKKLVENKIGVEGADAR